jgi:hypothetical protein
MGLIPEEGLQTANKRLSSECQAVPGRIQSLDEAEQCKESHPHSERWWQLQALSPEGTLVFPVERL